MHHSAAFSLAAPTFPSPGSLGVRFSSSAAASARPLMAGSDPNATSNGSESHAVHYSAGVDGASTAASVPVDKFRHTLLDPTKTPLVLVACGSFSPITYLHMRMFEMAADFVKRDTDFELVATYLSPVADAYKKVGLASARDRIRMCQLAADQTDRLMVDSWEANQKEYTRTAVVLDRFEHEINSVLGGVTTQDGKRRQCRIALLAGADLIGTMSTPGVWSPEDLDHILGRYGAFIIERSGTHMEDALAQLQKWRHNIWVVEQLIKNDVSSTKIRQFLKKDLSVRYLIPPAVIDYIEENGLYDEDGKRPHSRSRSMEQNNGTKPLTSPPQSPTIQEQTKA